MTTRPWVLIALSILIGASIAAVAMELVLRAFDYTGSRVYKPNPLYGWGLFPDDDFTWTTNGRGIRIRTNRFGLRDDDLTLAKAPGERRGLFLGDSFTEALQVEVEETFVERLERMAELDKSLPSQMLNAGVSGFGTDNELLYFRHRGVEFAPDVVVLGFYIGNDVRNNFMPLESQDGPKRKPHFEIGSSGAMRLEDFPFVAHDSFVTRTKSFLNRNVRLYGLVRQVRDALVQGPAGAPNSGPVPAPLDIGLFNKHAEPAWEQAWTLTSALIRTLRAEVHKTGASLVVVVIPTHFQVDPPLWAKWIEKYGLIQSNFDLYMPLARLEQILQQQQIPYLNLYGPITRHSAPGTLYIPDDGHWTAQGHEFAADAMAASGLLNLPGTSSTATPGIIRP